MKHQLTEIDKQLLRNVMWLCVWTVIILIIAELLQLFIGALN